MENMQEPSTVEECLRFLFSVENVSVCPSSALRWFMCTTKNRSAFDTIGFAYLWDIAGRTAFFSYDELRCPRAIYAPVYDGTFVELFTLVYRNE